MTYVTNTLGVTMHLCGLQMTCCQGQSESSITKETEVAWSLRCQLELGFFFFFNLAQLRFLAEVVVVNFRGLEYGKTTVKLAQRRLCRARRFILISIATEPLLRTGPLELEDKSKGKCQLLPENIHSFGISQSRPVKLELLQQLSGKSISRGHASC